MNILERLGRVWKMQEAYNDYPQAASENAKKALRYAEKYGWKSCGRLMWLAWGGDEGVNWAIRKIEQIRKENERN